MRAPYINEFINRSGGIGGYKSVTHHLKDLFNKMAVKFSFNMSNSPVDLSVNNDSKKITRKVDINLDKALKNLSIIIENRGFRKCTVIIDKIDKFVSGEDYLTQKLYIESLLEVEDDLFNFKNISLKIFLRKDLFERLNFSSLGPDKVDDNTLTLKWELEEILRFIATRLFVSLRSKNVWEINDIFMFSDLSEYDLATQDGIATNYLTNLIKCHLPTLYSKLFNKKIQQTEMTLFEKLHRIIISKLFVEEIEHEDTNGNKDTIECIDFFLTHFLDGNDSCTPRYILFFLKELISECNKYYSENLQSEVVSKYRNKDLVWDLFSSPMVYKSYRKSKERYLNHITGMDNNWKPHLKKLLSKLKNKKRFDFNWIQTNITFKSDPETEAEEFLAFLSVIGFFKTDQYNQDIKKRSYKLPVLYAPSKLSI